MNFSELNDTIVEAELRTLKSPPELPVEDAVQRFRKSKRRLIVMVSLSHPFWISHRSSILRELYIRWLWTYPGNGIDASCRVEKKGLDHRMSIYLALSLKCLFLVRECWQSNVWRNFRFSPELQRTWGKQSFLAYYNPENYHHCRNNTQVSVCRALMPL